MDRILVQQRKQVEAWMLRSCESVQTGSALNVLKLLRLLDSAEDTWAEASNREKYMQVSAN